MVGLLALALTRHGMVYRGWLGLGFVSGKAGRRRGGEIGQEWRGMEERRRKSREGRKMESKISVDERMKLPVYTSKEARRQGGKEARRQGGKEASKKAKRIFAMLV